MLTKLKMRNISVELNYRSMPNRDRRIVAAKHIPILNNLRYEAILAEGDSKQKLKRSGADHHLHFSVGIRSYKQLLNQSRVVIDCTFKPKPLKRHIQLAAKVSGYSFYTSKVIAIEVPISDLARLKSRYVYPRVRQLNTNVEMLRELREKTKPKSYNKQFRIDGVEIYAQVSNLDGYATCPYTGKYLTMLRGRVFPQPGTILKMAQEIKNKIVFVSKKPETSERHVGIEVEFGSPTNKTDIATALTEAGIGRYVQLKDDGSVRDFPSNYQTNELVICAPISIIRDVVTKAMNVINSGGAKVNKTCGLHVHLDMRGYDYPRAFSNLVSAQKILYQMVPASRRDNTYCKPTTSKVFSRVQHGSRYVGINPTSYRKHGTIEVRLHSGTTDIIKILNFVDILMCVAFNEKKTVRAATTVRGFAKQHGLSSYIESYIESRIRLFGGQSVQEEAA